MIDTQDETAPTQRRPLLESALVLADEALQRGKGRALARYRPYAKQLAFHAAGKDHRERLLLAGNQCGKSLAGAMEWAMHLTGDYPSRAEEGWDWPGRRFAAPVRLWALGLTAEATRDSIQRHLLGAVAGPAAWGAGAIPRRAIVEVLRRRSVPEAVDTVLVRHSSGGVSSLGFKTVQMGRERLQGETLDGVWFDEEPPLPVYLEGLSRTNARSGLVIATFTPLLGMTELLRLFLEREAEESPEAPTA